MNELAIGAEAVVYLYKESVIKVRASKGYRHKNIDKSICTSRTKLERMILTRLEPLGLSPEVLELEDTVKNYLIQKSIPLEYAIQMKYISGVSLATVIAKNISENKGIEEIRCLIEKIGQAIAQIHSVNVVHSDLTPNNIIVIDTKVSLIDFGLGKVSYKAEDKAVDLYVFEKSLLALLGESVSEMIENGYLSHSGEQTKVTAKEVIDRLQDVRKRGRKRELSAVG
ncbi:TP53 regulating kinase [Nematocida sp. AWRm80]|nr:TP53 regulating kinase [Nematocida sp. AWRm80]